MRNIEETNRPSNQATNQPTHTQKHPETMRNIEENNPHPETMRNIDETNNKKESVVGWRLAACWSSGRWVAVGVSGAGANSRCLPVRHRTPEGSPQKTRPAKLLKLNRFPISLHAMPTVLGTLLGPLLQISAATSRQPIYIALPPR